MRGRASSNSRHSAVSGRRCRSAIGDLAGRREKISGAETPFSRVPDQSHAQHSPAAARRTSAPRSAARAPHHIDNRQDRVCIQYDKSRRQHNKPWLHWRSRCSLGWVPFNTGHVAYRDGGFVFRGERYEVWLLVRCRRAQESARARSPRTPEGAGTSTAQSRSLRASACRDLGGGLAGSALTLA
jgi:hypothetical protein